MQWLPGVLGWKGSEGGEDSVLCGFRLITSPLWVLVSLQGLLRFFFKHLSTSPPTHFHRFPACLSSNFYPQVGLTGLPPEDSALRVPFVAWLGGLAQVLHLTSGVSGRSQVLSVHGSV